LPVVAATSTAVSPAAGTPDQLAEVIQSPEVPGEAQVLSAIGILFVYHSDITDTRSRAEIKLTVTQFAISLW
jgi:hypothetical protein